jgi:hypothetical protein
MSINRAIIVDNGLFAFRGERMSITAGSDTRAKKTGQGAAARTPGFLSRLFGSGSRNLTAAELAEDHRNETLLAESLARHAVIVPYAALRERMQRISEETRLSADALATAIHTSGGRLLDIDSPAPSSADGLIEGVQSDLETISLHRARYMSLLRRVEPSLQLTIRQMIDQKERHRFDLRDVYVRLVR